LKVKAKQRGEFEGGGLGVATYGRSADDGKRFLSVGRCIGKVLAKQRGEFEGGGLDV